MSAVSVSISFVVYTCLHHKFHIQSYSSLCHTKPCTRFTGKGHCSIGIPWHSMAFLLVTVGFIVFCLELQHWPWSRSPNVQRYIDSMDRLRFFVFFRIAIPPEKESHPVRWGYRDPQFLGVNIKTWLKLNHQDHHKLWRQSNVLVVFLHPMQFAYVERNMPCQGWCRCHSGGHFRPGMGTPGAGGFKLRDAVQSLSWTSIAVNFGFTEHKIIFLDLIWDHSWSNASTRDLRSYLTPNWPPLPLPYPRLEIHHEKTRPANCWIHCPWFRWQKNTPRRLGSEIETHHSSILQIYSKWSHHSWTCKSACKQNQQHVHRWRTMPNEDSEKSCWCSNCLQSRGMLWHLAFASAGVPINQ